MEQPRALNVHDLIALEAGRGDAWAMDEIVRQYQPMIIKFAKALLPGCESSTAEDLRQIGAIALMEMARKYDGRAAFITFAYRYMPLRMRRFADGDFQDRLVAPPTNELTKDRSRVKKTGRANHYLHAGISINNRNKNSPDGVDTMTDDEALTALAGLSTEANYEENVLIRQIWHHVDSLPPRERKFMELYFKAGLTLEQIAEAAGVTRQAVNTSVGKALQRLKDKMGLHNDDTPNPNRTILARSIKSASRH